MDEALFPVGEPVKTEKPAGPAGGKPRMIGQDHAPQRMCLDSLDDLLDRDHSARKVWAFAQRQDLSQLTEQIRSVEGWVGAPAWSPYVLLALWLYATIEGVGRARELADLCRMHLAYRWLCNDHAPNYHTLADFRSQPGKVLEDLLIRDIASLLDQGLIELNRVAQDGMRVRASAGENSYHRRPTLERHLAMAREQIERLKAEAQENPGALSARRQAAQKRAAREREERLSAALKVAVELEAKQAMGAQKKEDEPTPPASGANVGTARPAGSPARGANAQVLTPEEEQKRPRVSSTDPEARRMKMPNAGFNLAFNFQFATETRHRFVVGVDVNNAGRDMNNLQPMVEKLVNAYKRRPKQMLVDGNFANKAAIQNQTQQGTTIYAPVKRYQGRDPYLPYPGDSPEIIAWRQRMGSQDGKDIYKERASVAEFANAQGRNHGLYQVVVRGLEKVRQVGALFALAHNVTRRIALNLI